MSLTTTEETVKQLLETEGTLWHLTAFEIATRTNIPLSTVYVALKAIGAVRSKIDKNQFGYALPDPDVFEFPSVEDSLGTIDSRSWKDSAKAAIKVVSNAAIVDYISPSEYAEGFESIGYRFLELAAHAREVQNRADWKIVLGFDPDTTKE